MSGVAQEKHKRGVGMPAWLKLNHFGRVVAEYFGYVPYLVGSAAKGKKWRDVDVRLILADEDFDAHFGELTRPRCLNLKWNAACLAFAALGRDMTDLPIDFQIDRMTEANRDYGDEPRHALIFAERIERSEPEFDGLNTGLAAYDSLHPLQDSEGGDVDGTEGRGDG